MKHDCSAPLILLSPHPLSSTMALLRPFTALLLLTVLLSWAASQTPPLPLLQALRAQAPGSQGWRGGAASGQPLRYMLELYQRAADHEGRPRRGRSLSTNTVRLVQAASHGGQPWAGKVVAMGDVVHRAAGVVLSPGVSAWARAVPWWSGTWL